MSDLQTANLGMIGAVFEAVTSTPAAAADTANLMFENDFEWSKTIDDVNATDPVNEIVIGTLARRGMVVSAAFEPTSPAVTALNADANNYAQIFLQSRAATNTAAALALGTTNTTPTANGGTGNWSQWNSVALNVVAFDPNNAVIPAGGKLTVKTAKQGTGQKIPIGCLTVRIRYV